MVSYLKIAELCKSKNLKTSDFKQISFKYNTWKISTPFYTTYSVLLNEILSTKDNKDTKIVEWVEKSKYEKEKQMKNPITQQKNLFRYITNILDDHLDFDDIKKITKSQIVFPLTHSEIFPVPNGRYFLFFEKEQDVLSFTENDTKIYIERSYTKKEIESNDEIKKIVDENNQKKKEQKELKKKNKNPTASSAAANTSTDVNMEDSTDKEKEKKEEENIEKEEKNDTEENKDNEKEKNKKALNDDKMEKIIEETKSNGSLDETKNNLEKEDTNGKKTTEEGKKSPKLKRSNSLTSINPTDFTTNSWKKNFFIRNPTPTSTPIKRTSSILDDPSPYKSPTKSSPTVLSHRNKFGRKLDKIE